MIMLIHHLPQFLRCVERHHTPGGNRNLFASLGVPAQALRFDAQLKFTETGKLNAASGFQCLPDFREKRFDKVFAFSYVETHFFMQEMREFGLG